MFDSAKALQANPKRLVLLVVVFISGMSSLAVELSASRLIGPYFGSSLFIWAVLIGMELVYLTIGYTIGGRMADRNPSEKRLYSIVAIAAAFIGLAPLIARPILSLSLRGFASLDVGAFLGSLLGTILLFAVPITLLGMVTPFAIRLEITKLDQAGRTSGQIYALSTIGSIVGTFTPVFIFIPTFGTTKTFLIFGVLLLVSSGAGLWLAGARLNLTRVFAPMSLLILISIIGTAQPHTIKGAGPGAQLVTERESLYNYIQVVKSGDFTELVLNEGQAVHSIYEPGATRTFSCDDPDCIGIWDLFLTAPFFNNAPYATSDLKNAAIIGLAAGTIPRVITNIYGSQVKIDGVEIDPEIVDVGRKYFDMREPNLNVIVDDGRYYLDRTSKKYDLIGIDAYQQPYIPFQLTTKEFFQLVRNHLSPHGVMAINAGRTATNFALIDALATTIHAVYKKVYVINLHDVGNETISNSLIVATNDDTTEVGNLAANRQLLPDSDLTFIMDYALDPRSKLRVGSTNAQVFTDDHAPVEAIVNSLILDYIRGESGN